MLKFRDYEWFMSLAIDEAEKAFAMGEVPVGSVLVDENGNILSKSHNYKERKKLAISHSEIEAIIEASRKMDNWRLNNCTLFVTLEPCLMCLSAIQQSRIKRLVFGAYDPKSGSLSLGYNLNNDTRFNHRFDLIGGIKHYECSRLLSNFFKLKRR